MLPSGLDAQFGTPYLRSAGFDTDKLLLKKCSILGNKDLAFGSMVEGVPNYFLRVSYEDALLQFGFEIIRLKPLIYVSQPQTLRNDILGFLPNHSSYGVVSTDLDGALFNLNVAVSPKR